MNAAGRPGGFTHVVMTRFSLRAYMDTPPHSPEWLTYRLGLFEAFCVPSMAAQTVSDFDWLVYCDCSTDPACLRRLERLRRDVPQLEIVLTKPGDRGVEAAVERVRAKDRLLVTTRVDSDDGSSADLVERVQSYVPAILASGQKAMLVDFSRGYKLRAADGALFETWNPHSPHLTLVERLDSGHAPLTVQSGNHGFMQEAYPLHVDAGPPAWVQLVHGGNVSNHVSPYDREVPARTLGDRFAFRAAPFLQDPIPAAQPEDAAGRAAFRQALEEGLVVRRSLPREVPGARE